MSSVSPGPTSEAIRTSAPSVRPRDKASQNKYNLTRYSLLRIRSRCLNQYKTICFWSSFWINARFTCSDRTIPEFAGKSTLLIEEISQPPPGRQLCGECADCPFRCDR